MQLIFSENISCLFLYNRGAGTDTTIGELRWLWLRMAKEPEIQMKIQKEIECTIGKKEQCSISFMHTSFHWNVHFIIFPLRR